MGKSPLAQALASTLGWQLTSTDRLARHPGRPWATSSGPFPEHLAAHYLSLSIDELTGEQLRHYQRLWPRIEALVTAHAADAGAGAGGLIVEGSGVLPERAAALRTPDAAAVWLTASAAVLRERICAASRYCERTAEEKVMVDKFLGRTDRYNQLIVRAVDSHGLASIDTSAAPPISELIEHCRRAIG